MKIQRQPARPRLIILEGPAGVGKTTIQQKLYEKLKERNVSTGIVPEFTTTLIGKVLKKHAEYGKHKPGWLTGFEGNLVFLSDKFHAIEMTMSEPKKIWICDRFIDTQSVLGLKSITETSSMSYAKSIIRATSELIWKKIGRDSVFVFLTAREVILRKRLEKRIKRQLSRSELVALKSDIIKYHELGSSRKNSLCISNEKTTNEVCAGILNFIDNKWKQ